MSYHIAQYTGVISDLRSEIQRLKSQIEMQEEKRREAGIRATQGTPSTGQVPQATLLPWVGMRFVSSRSRKGPGAGSRGQRGCGGRRGWQVDDQGLGFVLGR